VLTAAGCGGAENATANNTAVKVIPTDAVNSPGVSNAPVEMANSGRTLNANGGNPATTGEMKPLSQPAPENSEYTMTLTDVGTETRTFKDHPQLDKVVKIVKPGSSSIKIHLKSGKVVDVAGDKIPSVKTVSTSELLTLAGVLPPPPPAPDKKGKEPEVAPTKQP
jgi:hypothetical protein